MNLRTATFSAFALLVLAFTSCKKNPGDQVKEERGADTIAITPADTITSSPLLSDKNPLRAEKQCYLKVTENVVDKNKTIRDSIIFEIARDGDGVKGIFNMKPFEKDKKLSTFTGVLNGNEGKVIASSKAEGMEYNEVLKFTLRDSTVTIYFGAMEQGANGIWQYKAKTRDSLSTQVLKRVPCK